MIKRGAAHGWWVPKQNKALKTAPLVKGAGYGAFFYTMVLRFPDLRTLLFQTVRDTLIEVLHPFRDFIQSAAALVAVSITALAIHAEAWPEWETYRLDSDSNRANFDADLNTIIKSVPVEGFSTKRIRFCLRSNDQKHALWETSPTASCQSTENGALKYQWPPVLTASDINYTWVAYSRFVQSYCREKSEHAACVKLVAPIEDRFAKFTAPIRAKASSTSLSAFLLSLVTSTAGAAEDSSTVCKFVEGVITTKDGEKVFVDFGVQPSENHAALLTNVAKAAADDKTSESVLKDGMAMLRAQGRVLVQNYQAKIPWIQERIAKDRVTWIGTEQTETELGDATGSTFAKSFDALKAQLTSRKLQKEAAEKAMTVGACPSAPVCHWLQDKTVRKNIKLVAIDSDALKSQGHELRKAEAAIFQELDALVAANKITKDEFAMIQREIKNIHLVSEPPDQKARNRARQRYSLREVSEAMVKLYDGVIAIKKNTSDRERAIAEKAFAQKGNGILSFSPGRRDTIVQTLESVCRGPEPVQPKSKPQKNTRPPARGKTAS